MAVHREWVEGTVEVRVTFVAGPTAVRVVIGPGVGQLDGGVEHTLSSDMIPPDLRRPNATFWITPEALRD